MRTEATAAAVATAVAVDAAAAAAAAAALVRKFELLADGRRCGCGSGCAAGAASAGGFPLRDRLDARIDGRRMRVGGGAMRPVDGAPPDPDDVSDTSSRSSARRPRERSMPPFCMRTLGLGGSSSSPSPSSTRAAPRSRAAGGCRARASFAPPPGALPSKSKMRAKLSPTFGLFSNRAPSSTGFGRGVTIAIAATSGVCCSPPPAVASRRANSPGAGVASVSPVAVSTTPFIALAGAHDAGAPRMPAGVARTACEGSVGNGLGALCADGACWDDCACDDSGTGAGWAG